jgi:flavorubredoxin
VDRREWTLGLSSAAVMALLRGNGAQAAAHRPGALTATSRRAYAANQTLTELVPERLYRIGCVVRAQRLSWLPRDLEAWEPLNSYLLLDSDHAVFVDLGMPIARPAMESALSTLIGERKVWLHYTRNEADCIGNLGLVLGSCANPTLLFGGAGGILEWINDPAVSLLEVRDFLGRVPIELSGNGSVRALGGLRLHFLEAVLRQMLLTQWVYEESTGTLFTSDSFGFRHLTHADAPLVLTSSQDLPDVSALAEETVARFNWLREARMDALAKSYADFFARYDVQRLAPVHGCIIEGRQAVAAHVRRLAQALRLAASLPDTERLRYG